MTLKTFQKKSRKSRSQLGIELRKATIRKPVAKGIHINQSTVSCIF